MASLLNALYFPGRRVRLTPKGAAKLLVPITVLYGLVLKLIEFPGSTPKVLVEFEALDGRILLGIYEVEDLEPTPAFEDELRKDLLERRVHFPRSSGIGITFPSNASDNGVIKNVRWAGGKVQLIVWVHSNDPSKTAPFVTPADFMQCDLLLRVVKNDTG